MSTDHAFLNLRALNAGKREELAAYVVESLDCVPVQRVRLVAQLEDGFDRVWVCLAAAVLERVDRQRVA